MTSMRRITISIPHDMDKKILEIRKKDEFVRASYSEIVRVLISAGLNFDKHENETRTPRQ